MRYRLLGPSGLRVSEICLGTMSFGESWGFGADAQHSREIIDRFAEAGGNFLDTANKYHEGETEKIVGEAISAERDRWVVATKFTLAMRQGDPNAAGNSRKNLFQSVHASLKRLGTDYIDLLWVHAWDYTTQIEEVLRGLDDLVRQGKVHYIGLSDTPAWVTSAANTTAALRGWTGFVAQQIEHSLIERTVERDLLPMADHYGMTTTAWGPIAGGVLTGKYTRHAEPKDTKRARGNEQRLTEENLAIARQVDAIADELGRSSAQVALNWVRQSRFDVIPIVGARKKEQIVDLLGCLEFTLDDRQMSGLDEASQVDLGFPHAFIERPQLRPVVLGDTIDRLDLPPVARRALRMK